MRLDFRFEAERFVIVVTMQLGINFAFVICKSPGEVIGNEEIENGQLVSDLNLDIGVDTPLQSKKTGATKHKNHCGLTARWL